jgi:hypothetical protein
VSNAISAVASLLWPLIVLAALVVFRNPLARLIRQRDFTVKIAGQELSVSDLSQQQTALITDLQKQVAMLEKQLRGLTSDAPKPEPAPAPTTAPVVPKPVALTTEPAKPARDLPGGPPLDLAAGPAPWDRLPDATNDTRGPDLAPREPRGTTQTPDKVATPPPSSPKPRPYGRPKPSGVLWVADRPEANVLEIARLQANHIHVDIATSTAGGLDLLASHRYELIISDMARVENGRPVPDAGHQFVTQVRALDRETPLVIYADLRAIDKYGREALAAGATKVTSNTYDLAREFAERGLV